MFNCKPSFILHASYRIKYFTTVCFLLVVFLCCDILYRWLLLLTRMLVSPFTTVLQSRAPLSDSVQVLGKRNLQCTYRNCTFFLSSKTTGHRLSYVSIPSSKTSLTYCIVGLMHYRRSPTVVTRPSTGSYPEPLEFALLRYTNSLKQFTQQRIVIQLFRAFLV